MLAPESFWARSDLNPVPISFLAGALVVVVGLIIGACDRLGGSSIDPAETSRAPTEFVPDSTVWLVEMDAEDRLLSPGKPQRIEFGPDRPTMGDSLQHQALTERFAGEVASPYGCVMSTPNVNGAPSEGAYRYETVYALFPQEVVAAAGGETRRVRFQMNSRVAYTTGRRAEAQVLRQARCRIPDTDRAQRLVRERLERFPAPDEKAVGKEIAGPPWSGQPTSSSCFTSSRLSGAQAKGAECVEWTLELACVETCDPSPTGMESDGCVTTCKVIGKTCVRYSFDQNPDSGGGGDDTGDDSDPCGSEGATDELCGPGTGGSTDPADDPCASDNPPDWCDIGCKLSSAELVDGYYLYDQASEGAKKTFINTLEEHGGSYGLDSEEDVRHFIAQTAHESQGEITKVENLNYQDEENLAATFSEFTVEGGPETYKASEYTGRPREIAEIVYAGELGNGKEGTGDAYRYRGRGPMQTTGKDNYEAFTDWYQDEGFGSTDFTENPGKLSNDAEIGTLAALQYWDENVLGSNEVDEDNLTVEDVTRAINGGDTGLDTRKEHFERAKDIDCKS